MPLVQKAAVSTINPGLLVTTHGTSISKVMPYDNVFGFLLLVVHMEQYSCAGPYYIMRVYVNKFYALEEIQNLLILASRRAV